MQREGERGKQTEYVGSWIFRVNPTVTKKPQSFIKVIYEINVEIVSLQTNKTENRLYKSMKLLSFYYWFASQ
jgi:hypothetical protein